MSCADKSLQTTVCECGKVWQGYKRAARVSHLRGAWHRNHRRILALLEKPCITYSEIALRLGLSRERVRQIARDFTNHDTGHERVKMCSFSKSYQEWEQYPRIKSLGQVNPKLELLPIHRLYDFPPKRRLLVRKLLINGYVCCLRSASHRKYQCSPGFEVVIYGKGLPSEVEYALFYLAAKDCWFVFPRERVPRNRTSFILRPDIIQPGQSGYTISIRHDYQSYLNAWHLLNPVAF